MSMPQYIIIAVVSSNMATLKKITKDALIFQPGVAPRYKLVTLDGKEGKRITSLEEIEVHRILLWIALDDAALAKCNEMNSQNLENPHYNRGFYDQHLPNPVIKIDSPDHFRNKVEEISEAFCATS